MQVAGYGTKVVSAIMQPQQEEALYTLVAIQVKVEEWKEFWKLYNATTTKKYIYITNNEEAKNAMTESDRNSRYHKSKRTGNCTTYGT